MATEDWKGGKEDRRFRRLSAPVDIRYVHHPQPGGNPESGLSKAEDVSGGGVRLASDHSYVESAILELAIELERDEPPVEALARVIWSRKTERKEHPFDIGVEFIGIEDKEKELIERKTEEVE